MAEEHESNSFELGALAEAVNSGDPRQELEGIRDFVVQELEGHRCKACMMSKLRTGDTAALVTKLMQVIAELKTISPGGEAVSELDRIRQRREAQRATAAKAEPHADPTEQRRSGSRRSRGSGGPVA